MDKESAKQKIKELVERRMKFKDEQQIKNLDYEIDQEIYKLYDITKEEQKIIEDSLG